VCVCVYMCVSRFASSFQPVSNWLNHSPLNVRDNPDSGRREGRKEGGREGEEGGDGSGEVGYRNEIMHEASLRLPRHSLTKTVTRSLQSNNVLYMPPFL